MRKEENRRKKQKSTLGLVIALTVVVLGGVLFVGAVSGWFYSGKVKIDEEFRDDAGLKDISVEEYEGLVDNKKSFVVLVDQDGCDVANKMRDSATKYSEEHNINIYRIMFEEMKNTSLHDRVKYYPSVAIVGEGRVAAYLKADSDDDAKMYNDYDEFEVWMNNNIEVDNNT